MGHTRRFQALIEVKMLKREQWESENELQKRDLS